MGGSLRSGMDHVPGTGPHRVGMVTPSVESLHNPTQFGFDSTLDAVSRHCEKKLRCPIQSCLDAIKHFNVFSQQGTCTIAKRCPEQRSPNLEWRCPPHSAAPRLDACFPGMVVSSGY